MLGRDQAATYCVRVELDAPHGQILFRVAPLTKLASHCGDELAQEGRLCLLEEGVPVQIERHMLVTVGNVVRYRSKRITQRRAA